MLFNCCLPRRLLLGVCDFRWLLYYLFIANLSQKSQYPLYSSISAQYFFYYHHPFIWMKFFESLIFSFIQFVQIFMKCTFNAYSNLHSPHSIIIVVMKLLSKANLGNETYKCPIMYTRSEYFHKNCTCSRYLPSQGRIHDDSSRSTNLFDRCSSRRITGSAWQRLWIRNEEWTPNTLAEP